MDNVQSSGMGHNRMLGKVRTAGALCAVGGAGWLVTGVLASAIGRPHTVAYALLQVPWIIVQLLLLLGVVGLVFSGAVSGWLGGIALGIALLGRVVFVLAEIHSSILVDDSILQQVGAVITAVGMTLVGIAVLRTRRWGGWQRFTPLLVGVYPFLVMFPFIIITDEPNILAIAGWGLPWFLLGYAIWTSVAEERPSRVS
jgi:hypothetical protein